MRNCLSTGFDFRHPPYLGVSATLLTISLHVLVSTEVVDNVLVEHSTISVLGEDIGVIVLARDVTNDNLALILQLTKEIHVHINMTCATTDTPAISQVNSSLVVHLEDHRILNLKAQ